MFFLFFIWFVSSFSENHGYIPCPHSLILLTHLPKWVPSGLTKRALLLTQEKFLGASDEACVFPSKEINPALIRLKLHLSRKRGKEIQSADLSST